MPTYDADALSDSVIAHAKGITVPIGLAWRDNPEARANGDAGAPRINGYALGGFFLGAHEASHLDEIEVSSGIDRVKNLNIEAGVSEASGSGTAGLQAALSDDHGSTYGSWQSIGFGAAASSSVFEKIYIDTETGDVSAWDTDQNNFTSSALTLPSGDVNAVKFRVLRLSGSTSATCVVVAYCVGGLA